jgi:curved DNA-binding protein CbpA
MPGPEPADEEPPPVVDLSDASAVLDAYGVLGLPLSAKPDDVKRRYRQLSKKCHPDLVADMDEEIRRVAEERFREITEAYELIREGAS